MNKFLLMSVIFLGSLRNLHASVNFRPIFYREMGSCVDRNLSFNAARFTKIPLNKVRDGLEIFLQTIFFINETGPDSGTVKVRTMEQGLVECKNTKEGEVCSYRPYTETKKFFTSTYYIENEILTIKNIGEIIKIRDDFPWLGYQVSFDQNFSILELQNQKVIGGAVQINFNSDDVNTVFICK